MVTSQLILYKNSTIIYQRQHNVDISHFDTVKKLLSYLY